MTRLPGRRVVIVGGGGGLASAAAPFNEPIDPHAALCEPLPHDGAD